LERKNEQADRQTTMTAMNPNAQFFLNDWFERYVYRYRDASIRKLEF
jgi:hypothetical protein